jgi:hypothetical protein
MNMGLQEKNGGLRLTSVVVAKTHASRLRQHTLRGVPSRLRSHTIEAAEVLKYDAQIFCGLSREGLVKVRAKSGDLLYLL